MDTPSAAVVFPAGEILADELEARGWSPADLAEIVGQPIRFVSEIISGQQKITGESAARLGAELGTSAEFWLNLQDAASCGNGDRARALQSRADPPERSRDA